VVLLPGVDDEAASLGVVARPDEGDRVCGAAELEQDAAIVDVGGGHQGRGRQILPPMPYPFIGTLTDADLRAIFAFLKSTKPVKNRVPDYAPPGS